MTALTWALTHIRAILGGAALAAILLALTIARADARHWHKVADNDAAQLIQLQADVKAKTTAAQLADTEHARATEGQSTTITTETTDAYERRLAALAVERDRAQRLLAAAKAHPGSGGAAGLPGLPSPAVLADGAAGEAGLSLNDAYECSVTSERLIGLQGWLVAQKALYDAADAGSPDR